MNKEAFFTDIKNVLEIEGNVNEKTPIYLGSMEILSVIAFIDENFETQVKTSDLKAISTLGELVEFIGNENFKP